MAIWPFKRNTAVVEKGFADASFGPSGSFQSSLTVNAVAQRFKNLSSNDCFELVCSVRTAFDSIGKNLRKAKWRLFNRNGEEITSGPAFDLLRRPSPDLTGAQLTEELAYWFSLENEVALNLIPGGSGISALLPLNPQRLQINDPSSGRVNHVYDIKQWRYQWYNGAAELIRADYLAFDHGWNPVNPVRGLSPLVTGQNWAGLSHHLSKHNLNFFQNSAIPSHLLVLPAGTNQKQREEFEQRYLQQFSTYSGQSQKVMVVSGGEVKIEKLERDPKEGEFLDLEKLATDKIAALYKVPELEMGTTREVRFETAMAQRQVFHDATLCPLAERFSQFMQTQVIDPWFGTDSLKSAKRSDANLSGRLEKAYRNTLDAMPGSDIIVILDTDTMPIVAQIRLDNMKLLQEVRNSADLSANEAAEYVGIDLPTSEAKNVKIRDDIYVPSGRVNLNDPTMFLPPTPRAGDIAPPKPSEPNKPATSAKPRVEPKKELTDEQRKSFRKFEVAYRRLLLESKGRHKLKDADALTDDPKLRAEIRRDFFHIHESGLAKGNDPTPEIKAYLNAKYTRIFFKDLAG